MSAPAQRQRLHWVPDGALEAKGGPWLVNGTGLRAVVLVIRLDLLLLKSGLLTVFGRGRKLTALLLLLAGSRLFHGMGQRQII